MNRTSGASNGDIPDLLAKGDGPQRLRWRRRAVRSAGKRGLLRLARCACPRLTLFAPSRSRARRKFPDGNFRRPLVGSLRALTSAKLVIGEASRRPVLASSSPRSIRSQRESTVGRRTTRRALSPFARRPHRTPPPPRSAAPFPIPSYRGLSPRVEKIARPDVLVLAEAWSRALFSQQRQMRTSALASTRGPCGAGGRAFRGLTRSATEWSGGEEEATTGRRIASQRGAISADDRPVGFRRANARKGNGDIPHFPSKRGQTCCRSVPFCPPSGEMRNVPISFPEARATLREQSGSTLGRRGHQPPSPVPIC